MGGLIKGLLVLVLVVLVAAGAGLFWLSNNLNDLLRDGVETYGPRYTGTEVTLEAVDLSILSGEGELRGLVIGNPAGYDGADPIRLGRVRLALDPSTLTEDVIVVREIIVEEAELHAMLRSLRESNLQTILDNVTAAAPASEPEADAPASDPIKVIIDRFSFADGAASVTAGSAGAVNVDIPDLELTGIGRRSNGETIGEAAAQMIGPVVGAITQAGVDGQLRSLLDGQLDDVRGRVEDAAGGFLDKLPGGLPFGGKKDGGSER